MIELRVLGAVDLRRRDGPELLSVLSQPKRTALLAYLLLARPHGFHRRDKLVALFWREADAEHGRNSLRQSVYFLRRSLGEEVLPSRGEEELGAARELVWCDARAFEEALDKGDAEGALNLYRGELLPGFFVEGAPEFERWLDLERARLRERAVRAASDLLRAREAAGDAAGAAEIGARTLALAPDDEALLRGQMQRLARLGDRAGALSAYESFERRMSDEFDLEPEPETRALADSIRARPIPACAVPAASAATPPQAPPPALSPVQDSFQAHFVPAQTAAAGAGELPRGRRSARRYALIAAGVLAVCGVAIGVWLALRGREPTAVQGRVVVGAFENRTGDPALAPLGEMAADWISEGLTATGIVEVVDAAAAFAIAREAGRDSLAGPELVRLLSRETGAGLVVTGRYYRDADSLEFVARVVDARSGKVVRAVGPVSAPMVTPVRGAERLRERLMAELAVLLDDRLARFQALERQPPRYEAYREYMDGLAGYLATDTTAVDHFDRAFALDSTFYRAALWAAECLFNAPNPTNLERYDSLIARVERLRARLTPAEQHQLDFVRAARAGDVRAAYAAARRRWQAAPGSDDALRELVFMAFRVYRFREANELYDRIDWNRGLLGAMNEASSYVGTVQHLRGDFEGELRTAPEYAQREPDSYLPDGLRLEALAALGRAAEVRSLASRMADRLAADPNVAAQGLHLYSEGFNSDLAPFELGARQLNEHGKPVEARALAGEGVARCTGPAPTPAGLRPESRLRCANLLGFVGRWRDADRLLRGMHPLEVLRPEYLTYAGMAAARLGERARALAISDSLSRLPVRTVRDMYMRPTIEYRRAMIAAALGDREDALRRLRLWRAAADWSDRSNFSSEPVFIPYFSDPRFRKLLESED